MKLILRVNGFELESESKLDNDIIKLISENGLRIVNSSLETGTGKRTILLIIDQLKGGKN